MLRQQAGVAAGLAGSRPGAYDTGRPRQTNLEEIIRQEASLTWCEILCKKNKTYFLNFSGTTWAKERAAGAKQPIHTTWAKERAAGANT